MEITVGPVLPAESNNDSLKVVPVQKYSRYRDRRQKNRDRRKNVREGIFVTLSSKKDRRHPGDRRRSGG